MNFLQIFGRLGADPETRFTSGGQKVTSFRVACNVKKGGKEMTMWWRVTCWGDRFDKMMTYLKKGSAVIVMGTMGMPEIYTSRDGAQQVSLDITADSLHFSPFGGGGEQKASHQPAANTYSESNLAEVASPAYGGASDDYDEEPMPF